jgi:hypothetical protein
LNYKNKTVKKCELNLGWGDTFALFSFICLVNTCQHTVIMALQGVIFALRDLLSLHQERQLNVAKKGLSQHE